MWVDDQPDRAVSAREMLAACECEVIATLNTPIELYARVTECAPDIIIIATDSPSRDVIEHISFISRDQPRPIVMFSGDREDETIRAAMHAGVTAYIVDGLSEERIQPILAVAMERFRSEQLLKSELAGVKTQLAERKLTERAKGIIMKQRRVDEEEAFRMMRTFAMDRGIKMAQAAEQIIALAKVLG
jgi:response regulator NasT